MKKHSSLRRILAVCLSLAMVLTLAPGAARAADSNGSSVSFEELDPSEVSIDLRGDSGIKTEQEKLDNIILVNDTDRVRVTIVLPGEAAISMVEEGLDVSDARVVAYREQLEGMQENAAEKISDEALDGEPLDVVWNLTLAVNAISANVEYGQIEKIAKVDGVKAVYVERRYDPLSTGGNDLNNVVAQGTTGANAVKLSGYTGAGMRIAVVDTGTAKWHQSFDAGAFEHSLEQLAAAKGVTKAAYVESLNLLTKDEIAQNLELLNAYKRGGYTADDLYISSKLPFGYCYIDNDTDISHWDAGSEHGSHVAGIAAANSYIPNPKGSGYVKADETVGVTGVASDAQIITLKVFGGNGGAYTSDNFAAIEDAMVLHCDVVNLSLGSSCGFVSARGEYMIVEGDTSNIGEGDRVDSWVDSVMDRIATNGIIMCVSAGNSGNWAEGDDYSGVLENPEVSYTASQGMMYTNEGGTYNVGQPSTYHNTMSVASADNVGSVAHSKSAFSATKGSVELPVYSTTSMNNPDWSVLDTNKGSGKEYDVVFLGDPSTGFAAGQMQDNTDLTIFGGTSAGPDLTGKIVMISRGGSSFFQKRDAAAALGAVAVICYNHTPGAGVVSADLTGTTTQIPFGGLSFEDAKRIYDICDKTEGTDGAGDVYSCKLTVYDTLFIYGGVPGAKPTMSDYSSWGTTGALTIKPEITTPGGSIYSVNGGDGEEEDTDQYENMSGTSMAAPHFSGLVALTQQYLRNNNKAALKKAQDVASGLTERQLVQSLLMSTAEPLVEYTYTDGNGAETEMLYSVRDQGAGLANVQDATRAKSFILVDGQPDGKVKAELGEGTAPWNFAFTIYNMSDAAQTYNLSADMMTTGTDTTYPDYDSDLFPDWYFVTNQMVPLDADVTFSTGSSVSVPANGSVKVRATVTVNDAAVTAMEALGYTNGFYVEGYVYAEPTVDGDGNRGVTHSIPMLGWYGSWTATSMYDNGTLLDYYYWDYDSMPHLPHVFGMSYTDDGYLSLWSELIRNALLVTYEGDDPADVDIESMAYTGNIYGMPNYGIEDSQYIADRNALNNTGSAAFLPTWFRPTLIRNAIAARVQVVGSDGHVYYERVDDYPMEGAYPNNQLEILMDTSDYNQTPIEYDFSDIPEGTSVTISLTCAPEYYVNDDGSIRWNEIGSGATLSFPFRIDNTAPQLLDAVVGEGMYGPTLTVTAKDENYIAYMAVLDGAASMMEDLPVCPDMEVRGEEYTYEFDISDAVGNKIVVALCDYAGNERFFAVNISDVEYPGGGYGSLVAFQTGYDYYMGLYHQWVSFNADVMYDETSMFISDTEFYAADYVDGVVYAQDAQGWLYAIRYADMTEGVTDFESARIARLPVAYQDMAYNYNDGMLYGIRMDASSEALVSYVDQINLNNDCEVTEYGYVEDVAALGLACDDDGTLYLMGLEDGEGTAKLYTGVKQYADIPVARYDLNGDQAVNLRDAQSLMDHVVRGTNLQNLHLADFNNDGQYTTVDVHIFLDILNSYRSKIEYTFEMLMDTDEDMNYLQSMTWDHNDETLYWAQFTNSGLANLWVIDVDGQALVGLNENGNPGFLSTETYAMFAPLTAANAAKDVHSRVPTTSSSGVKGTPVLVDTVLNLAIGGSRALDYDIDPWYAEDKDVTWSTSNPSVATVDQNGLVTAVGEGTCTITVANAAKTKLKSTCTVNVVNLSLTINGTYSEMGGNVMASSDSFLYTFTLNGASSDMVQGPQIQPAYPWESFGQCVASAVLTGNGSLWTCEWGNTGMIQQVDPATGAISEICEPVDGDVMFGLAYSQATGMSTGAMNYYLYVDLPDFDSWYESDLTADMWDYYNEETNEFLWHRLDLSRDLAASDKGFNTGEEGDGSIVDVVIASITNVDDCGPVELTRDFLGGRGASGSYTPATTLALLDNVGRVWYIDELTGMAKDGDTYTGDCGTVSGTTGIHTWEYPDGTCSVFVIREIVETPLADMYWQGTMPRYSYHFSDMYYAGRDNSGNEVYLLSLYDYHRNGTTNQLYMLIMDENGRLIELGNTGAGNVIATIYDATVNMNSLSPAAAYDAYDGYGEDWEAVDGVQPLAVGPYAR